MQFETLEVSLENHIATVRLNRPDKANAMSATMWQEIRQAFQWVDTTPEARVAVLQGEGKLFTAGIDLQMMMGLGPQIQNDCDGRTREALRRVILDLQDTLTSVAVVDAHDRVLTTPSYTAYTRIGEGCSNCCTFCAIPKIRGPYRSRPEADILREIESLAKQGVKEHILVAQDTSRYGMDFGGGSKLAELMQKAAKIDGVDWLRVLYCYPEETSEQLLDIIANTPNICSYVDLPIQHVNDAVLKRMHRRGTSADIRRAVKGAHDRGITLRTSIIVGFPGETEEQFQELLDFLPEAEFDRLGAFTYSPEEGTPAAKMPDQIPEEVKAERLDRLMKRQAAIARKKNQARVGTVEKVLVTDRNARGEILGRSQREAPEPDGEIIFTAGESKMPSVGDFVDVRIEKASTYDLTGVIA